MRYTDTEVISIGSNRGGETLRLVKITQEGYTPFYELQFSRGAASGGKILKSYHLETLEARYEQETTVQ